MQPLADPIAYTTVWRGPLGADHQKARHENDSREQDHTGRALGSQRRSWRSIQLLLTFARSIMCLCLQLMPLRLTDRLFGFYLCLKKARSNQL